MGKLELLKLGQLLVNRLGSASRRVKKFISRITDTACVSLSVYLSHLLVTQEHLPIVQIIMLTVCLTFVSLVVFKKLGIYNTILRYMSNRAIVHIVLGSLIASTTLFLISWLNNQRHGIEISVCYFFICAFLLCSIRLSARTLFHSGRTNKQRINTIIYGAGSAGRQLAIALSESPEYKPACFIDDDDEKQGRSLQGLKIYSPEDIDIAVDATDAQIVLLAFPSTPRSRRKIILDKLQAIDIKVMTTPGMADIVKGSASVDTIKEVDVDDLLGRDPIPPIGELMEKNIKEKVVMITGAGGSIGSELCRQVITQQPSSIVLFEVSEYALYTIDKELHDFVSANNLEVKIIPIMGSVQRINRIETVMKAFNVNTVYHAAAYKHVPLVEHNVVEGVRNNIFGTLHTAKAAINAGVESFVLISTDKAVRPTNVMGATKRMAELILQALADKQSRTRFCMVRFGNVLGSSGSVIPLFRKQIHQGGPITLTHPNITRYFMTIPEAAQLVIQAGSMGKGGDVFVLDMGESVKIKDLAEKLVLLSGLTIKSEENKDGDIEIKCTGLRPGEKLYEELLIGDDVRESGHERIMTANEVKLCWTSLELLLEQLDKACHDFDHQVIRKILLEAPAAFSPSDEICDLVWLQKVT